MDKIVSWKSHEKLAKQIQSWKLKIYRPTASIWLGVSFGLCSKFRIVMLGRRQTIFSTPCFQFEKRIDFLFVHVMTMRDDLLCLAS